MTNGSGFSRFSRPISVQVLGQWEVDGKSKQRKKKNPYRKRLATELAKSTSDGRGSRASRELGPVGLTPLLDRAGAVENGRGGGDEAGGGDVGGAVGREPETEEGLRLLHTGQSEC